MVIYFILTYWYFLYIRNIIDNLKTENIQRIRIGISKNEIPLMDYVLGRFTPEEDKKIT